MGMKPSKKRISAVRVVHWAMILYLFVAVLHGAVPAIWRHHVENGDEGGPFRLLLFTVTLLAMAAFLPLVNRLFFPPPVFGALVYVTPEYLNVWTLRGPPLSALAVR